MNNKNGYFKETGVFTNDGESLTLEFKTAIDVLFDTEEVQDLTVSEIRLLGTNMMAMVADRVARRIAHKQQVANKLEAMSDKEFEEYLEEKYGSVWRFISLPVDELNRVPVPSQEEIKKLLKKGAENCTPVHQGGLIIEKPKRRYKK